MAQETKNYGRLKLNRLKTLNQPLAGETATAAGESSGMGEVDPRQEADQCQRHSEPSRKRAAWVVRPWDYHSP